MKKNFYVMKLTNKSREVILELLAFVSNKTHYSKLINAFNLQGVETGLNFFQVSNGRKCR